jgi:TPR repeat protein
MYPVFRSAKQPAAKNFVAGLQTEFGLKEHTNTGKALQFYETAVKQKSLEAMLRLGDMYSAPRGTTRGIEQNYNRAIQYYTMAAKMNNEYARTRIRELEQAMRPAKKVRDKNKKK